MAKKIYVVGNIGRSWWDGDGVTAQSFAKEFDDALASGEDIEVDINSPGGSVFEGIAIYNKIAANADKVTTIVSGIAYSMGAVIAMAGKTRKAYKNATIMIHNVSGGAYGNAKDLRSALEMMDALDNSLVESIAQFTGLTAEDVKAKWFDYTDHTLSAQAAVDAGLLTEVIDLAAENVPTNFQAMSQKELIAYFAKLNNPAQEERFIDKLANKLRNALAPNTPPVQVVTDPVNNLSDMKIMINKSAAAVVAALGLQFTETETEKEVDLTAEHINTLNAALSTAQNSLTEAQNNITTLTSERNDYKAKYEATPLGQSANAGADKEGDDDGGAANNGIGAFGDEDADYVQQARAMFGNK